MNATEKLILLNTAAMKIRDGMKEIEKLFKDNQVVSHHIWKLNKEIMKMHVSIQAVMESEVTKEHFKPIVEQIKEDGNDG